MSPELQPLGRSLIIFGVILVVVGSVLLLGQKLPWLGRLPGDIAIRREHFSFYFPLASCIVLSVILSLIAWLISRFHR